MLLIYRKSINVELGQKIGEGTFGTVYKAQDLNDSDSTRFCAIKRVRSCPINISDESFKLALREFIVMKSLRHKYIVKFLCAWFIIDNQDTKESFIFHTSRYLLVFISF